MTSFCALCQSPLTTENSSNEHIIPNAIGGRKTARTFICKCCNSETGQSWDNALCDQLKSFGTMLGVKRARGTNQPVAMRGADGKKFVLNPDASISIPHIIRTERTLAGEIEVAIEAKSMHEAKRLLKQEARKHSNLNVEEILSNATNIREQIQFPLRMSFPLFLSGDDVGRSIIKSCLGLAYQAGVSTDDCEDARKYLKGTGDACFGHYSEIDLVKNRPVGVCFHCICVHGDPAQSHILAYIEFFGYQRIVARLSDNYRGDAFSICHAIDPVSGESLDLDVALEFTQDEIPAILANERVDDGKVEECLKGVLATCLRHLMTTNAVERANLQCDVKSGQELSEEQFMKWSDLVAQNLALDLLGISPDHALGIKDERKV